MTGGSTSQRPRSGKGRLAGLDDIILVRCRTSISYIFMYSFDTSPVASRRGPSTLSISHGAPHPRLIPPSLPVRLTQGRFVYKFPSLTCLVFMWTFCLRRPLTRRAGECLSGVVFDEWEMGPCDASRSVIGLSRHAVHEPLPSLYAHSTPPRAQSRGSTSSKGKCRVKLRARNVRAR
jgi:hypothetical protein